MPVSIREVAAQAGVSLATVSRVLNRESSARIAPQTRERVELAASSLGYHPSAVARALVRRQTDTLGVVLPPTDESPLRNSFFSALLDGVLEAATGANLDTMVFTSRPSWGSRSYLSKLRDGRCDGLILFHQPSDSEIIPALLDASVPSVMVGGWREDPRLPCVDVENTESFYQMTQYLLGLGHRRIALLSAGQELYFVPPRITGFRRAFESNGLIPDETLIITAVEAWKPELVIHWVDALLALSREMRPTALCCTSDDTAQLVLSALGRRGVQVPEEISVTGFNDDINALRQQPPLTTMRQPYEGIGTCAIALLRERIADPSVPARKVNLPTELVRRGSTAPPPKE